MTKVNEDIAKSLLPEYNTELMINFLQYNTNCIYYTYFISKP